MNTFDINMDVEYNGYGRDHDDWLHHRYLVTLRRGHRHMTVPYKMGVAHNNDGPELAGVLRSLQSDAQIVANDDLDDVLGSMPFSQARKIADALERQTARLEAFLGDAYPDFLREEYDQ